MAYIDVVATSSTSIQVEVAGLDTAYSRDDRVVTWKLNGSTKGTSSLGAYVSSGGGFTFSGLSPSTTYTISCSISYHGGTATPGSTTATTSAPPVNPASFYIASYDHKSVTIRVIVGSYSDFRILIRTGTATGSGTQIGRTDVYETSNFYFTIPTDASGDFGALMPNTTYTVNVRTNLNSTWLGGQDFTTEKAPIEKWSWTSSNGDATTAQTKVAYNAVTGKGYTTDFSYLVWNDLVNRVNDAVTAAGYSWSSRYATLANTKMTTTDKEMTAVRFNSVLYNIDSHYSTTIPAQSRGNTMYGHLFTDLTTALNNWIDIL